MLLGAALSAAGSVRRHPGSSYRDHDVVLGGPWRPRRKTTNGKRFPDTDPLQLTQGERVRAALRQPVDDAPPMNVHGHTFALASGGARKGSVIVRPMTTLDVDLDDDVAGLDLSELELVVRIPVGEAERREPLPPPRSGNARRPGPGSPREPAAAEGRWDERPTRRGTPKR